MPEIGNQVGNFEPFKEFKANNDSIPNAVDYSQEPIFDLINGMDNNSSSNGFFDVDMSFLEENSEKIPNGHSQYEYKGAKFDIHRRGDSYKSQFVRPKGFDDKEFFDKFSDLEPLKPYHDEPSVNDATVNEKDNKEVEAEAQEAVANELLKMNGIIDEGFTQGVTGDCWLLTAIYSLAQNEQGRQIIQDSITINDDSTVTISFKGIGVSYTLSAEEILDHDTDSDKSDDYSNGDNDMLAFELAAEKLWEDISAGNITLQTNNPNILAAGNQIDEGGLPSQMIYYLTGVESRECFNSDMSDLRNEQVYSILQQALDSGNTVLNFGIYNNAHSATLTNGARYSIDVGSGGHALSITGLTQDTVTFINPWDGNTEYQMTWEEFANLGIGYMSSSNLDETTQASQMQDFSRPYNGKGARNGHYYSNRGAIHGKFRAESRDESKLEQMELISLEDEEDEKDEKIKKKKKKFNNVFEEILQRILDRK